MADDLYDGQRTDLRRRPGAEAPGRRCSRSDAGTWAPRRPGGAAGTRDCRSVPAVQLPQSPVGRARSSTSARTWSAGSGCGSVAGSPDDEVIRPARRGARGRRARRPAAAHGQGHRLLHRSPGDDEEMLGAAADLPRLPLRRGHRRAASCSRRTSRPSSSAPTCAAPAGSSRPRALLNRFHENVVWGMRGNFLDVPTDCPQRDERLGWTGDIQVFSPTASFLFDSAGFLSVWLADLAADQHDGRLGAVRHPGRAAAPRCPADRRPGATPRVVPWVLYQRFGDAGMLRRPAAEHARPGSTGSPSWPAPTALWPAASSSATGSTRPPRRTTRPRPRPNPDVVATAYLARSAERGRAGRRRSSATETARRQYARPGRPRSGTAFAARVRHRRRPDARATRRPHTRWRCSGRCCRTGEQRTRAGDRLADLVRDGRLPDRHRLRRHTADDRRADRRRGAPTSRTGCCCRRGCPSWLYPVTMGATTVWERWDSMLPGRHGSTRAR